jgi:hypothetical protein
MIMTPTSLKHLKQVEYFIWVKLVQIIVICGEMCPLLFVQFEANDRCPYAATA